MHRFLSELNRNDSDKTRVISAWISFAANLATSLADPTMPEDVGKLKAALYDSWDKLEQFFRSEV
jgi:hypothetical protein